MKVGIQRDNLENELYKAIIEINLDRGEKNDVFNRLVNRGYQPDEIRRILNGNISLEFLDQFDLGVLAYEITAITDNKKIDPEQFYDEIEMHKIKNYEINIKDNKEILTEKLIFKNVLQLADDQWVGKISIQDFVKLFYARRVNYNFETQRSPSIIRHKGGMIKRPNINAQSVNQITERMLNNQYIYDDVTLNILSNGEEDFNYDVINKVLLINNGQIDILDGAHRAKASENALISQPDLIGNFILVITNFDVDKANSYIIQKDKRNPLDQEYVFSKDLTNLSTNIVKRLNEGSTSDIRGLISDTTSYDKSKLTSFSIMSKTIDKLWQPKTRKDVKDVSDYLIEFFNALVGIYPEELKLNIKENRRKNLINHHNMFVYYLTIAHEIQYEENWEDLLYRILNNTDFSRDNVEWKNSILISTHKNTSQRLGKFINQYKDKIKERAINGN